MNNKQIMIQILVGLLPEETQDFNIFWNLLLLIQIWIFYRLT